MFARDEAIAVLRELCPRDALFVTANGLLARETIACGDAPEIFYMLGSMGLASSIGLGIAAAQPERTVIVLDGDGNLLMNLGVVAMIAAAAPGRFLHVVLDNESYQTTGGQPTLSVTSPLDEIALAAGYRSASRTSNAGDLRAAASRALASEGPIMLLVKVLGAATRTPPRIPVTPAEMALRFRAAATLRTGRRPEDDVLRHLDVLR